MGFRTGQDALRAAERVAGDTTGELRGADCGEPVGGLTAALPGGNAAGAASSFSNSWQAAFKTWCTDAGPVRRRPGEGRLYLPGR